MRRRESLPVGGMMFFAINRNLKLFCFSLLISVVLFSCSKESLSINKAEKLLNEYLKKENPYTCAVRKEAYARVDQEKTGEEKQYKELSKLGLIKMTFIREEQRDVGRVRKYTFELTDEGKRYATGKEAVVNPLMLLWAEWGVEVICADRIVKEIHGMTAPSDFFGKKVSSVEFSYTYKPTPFGKVFMEESELNSIQKDKEMFVLYEDGWRVK